MSYWRDDEEALQGFGSPAYAGFGQASLPGQACTTLEYLKDPVACTKTAAAIGGLEAKMAAAQAQITGLVNQAWCGRTLAEAMQGAVNPTDIATRAKVLAEKFASNLTQQNLYRYFYSEASAAMSNPLVQDFQKVAANISAKGGLDASGIGDVVQLTSRILASSLALVGALKQVLPEEVSAWLQTGLSCAQSIGSQGMLGVASCAVAVVGQLVSNAFTKPTVTPSPEYQTTSFAYFTPSETQRDAAALDAARLAALLRYRFNVPSVQALLQDYWTAVKATSKYNVCTGWKLHPSFFEAINGSVPPAAYTTTDLLWTLTCYRRGSAVWAKENLLIYWAMKQLKYSQEMVEEDYPCHLALSSFGTGVVCQDVPSGRVALGDVPLQPLRYIAYYATGNLCKNPTDPVWGPYVWYVDLLTFFAAVTLRELETDLSALRAAWTSYGLPVRFWAVSDNPNDGLDPRVRSSRYSANYWTHWRKWTRTDLLTRVQNKELDALYEFANLRLLAAVSYLRLLLAWGKPVSKPVGSLLGGVDAIADLPSPQSVQKDPAGFLRLPIDPRVRPLAYGAPMTVHATIVANEKAAKPIVDAARKQAQLDAMVITPAAQAGIKFAVQQQQALQQLPVLQTTGFKLPPPTGGGGAGTVITLAALALIAAKLLR